MEKHAEQSAPAQQPLAGVWALTEEERGLLPDEPPAEEGSTWELYQDEHAYPAWL